MTVAEPWSPPVRIGAPWRRRHGPNEDAEGHLRHLGNRWAMEAPGLDTCVVYEPISLAAGMKYDMAAHPAGQIAIARHLRTGLAHVAVGSAAVGIVHGSTAPALAVPVR